MKQELNLLRHAFLFYSRIPAGRIDYSDENLIKAFRYLPLVGIIVGGLSGLSYTLTSTFLPVYVSVILSMIVSILLTGGLHEDGLSDFFDAFGGGHSKDRTLEIMKDSHIGVYGVLSLIFLCLMKFSLLLSLPQSIFPLVLIGASASARLVPIIASRISTYARKDGQQSKSMHLRIPIDRVTLFIAILFALLPLFFLPWQVSALVLPLYVILLWAMKWYTERRIGGYTGDTLGALEQFCEVAFYVSASIVTNPL